MNYLFAECQYLATLCNWILATYLNFFHLKKASFLLFGCHSFSYLQPAGSQQQECRYLEHSFIHFVFKCYILFYVLLISFLIINDLHTFAFKHTTMCILGNSFMKLGPGEKYEMKKCKNSAFCRIFNLTPIPINTMYLHVSDCKLDLCLSRPPYQTMFV